MTSHQKEQKAIELEIMKLIENLEFIYMQSFESLSLANAKEFKIAKITQVFLQSKEAAIEPLKARLEITH